MEKKFKPTQPGSGHASPIETKKELSFEEGVTVSLIRIEELLQTLKRNVFVVINGSATDVGKNTLLAVLQRKLMESGITCDDVGSRNIKDKEQKVIFGITEGLIWHTGGNYKNDTLKSVPGSRLGTHDCGDLYIGIYRPDKRFPIPEKFRAKFEPVADIMIRNQHAKDDPYK